MRRWHPSPGFLVALTLGTCMLFTSACSTNTESPDGGGLADVGSDAPVTDAGAQDASLADTAVLDTAVDAGCLSPSADLMARADGLFFTSESDYPILVASFPGAGAAPPDAALVLQRSSAPTGATTETQTADWFWAHVVVDVTRVPPVPDTRPAELRAAVEAALTDIVVIRVIDPAAPTAIGVYLAGRTACGELVWLNSTSIET